MSSVKDRVIRIVNGLPPEEPKVLVELAPDETVVKSERLAALDELVAHDQALGLYDYNLSATEGVVGFLDSLPKPDPEVTDYLRATFKDVYGHDPVTDPTGFSSEQTVPKKPHWEPEFMKMEPDSDVKKFIKFKMFDRKRIIPSEQPTSEIAFRFYKSNKLPEIVLN